MQAREGVPEPVGRELPTTTERLPDDPPKHSGPKVVGINEAAHPAREDEIVIAEHIGPITVQLSSEATRQLDQGAERYCPSERERRILAVCAARSTSTQQRVLASPSLAPVSARRRTNANQSGKSRTPHRQQPLRMVAHEYRPRRRRVHGLPSSPQRRARSVCSDRLLCGPLRLAAADDPGTSDDPDRSGRNAGTGHNLWRQPVYRPGLRCSGRAHSVVGCGLLVGDGGNLTVRRVSASFDFGTIGNTTTKIVSLYVRAVRVGSCN